VQAGADAVNLKCDLWAVEGYAIHVGHNVSFSFTKQDCNILILLYCISRRDTVILIIEMPQRLEVYKENFLL
jgi:hypothetical protein